MADNRNEPEQENEEEEYSSSWPTAFTRAASDIGESDAPKQVRRLNGSSSTRQCCFRTYSLLDKELILCAVANRHFLVSSEMKCFRK